MLFAKEYFSCEEVFNDFKILQRKTKQKSIDIDYSVFETIVFISTFNFTEKYISYPFEFKSITNAGYYILNYVVYYATVSVYYFQYKLRYFQEG